MKIVLIFIGRHVVTVVVLCVFRVPASPQFRDLARHADSGNAFVRKRKLPLPALVAVMLSGMRKSIQSELDEFFAHLKEQAQLVHHISEQAFAKARAKLSTTAIPALNDWLVVRRR